MKKAILAALAAGLSAFAPLAVAAQDAAAPAAPVTAEVAAPVAAAAAEAFPATLDAFRAWRLSDAALPVPAVEPAAEREISTLDPADRRARARMTRFGPLGVLGRPVSHLARGRIASLSIPMRWVADLPVMGRDPQLGALCARDPLGGGAKVPLGFLASYMLYQHTPPEQVRTPVVLLHPAEDQWTPAELSVRVLRRLGSPGRLVMLRECGHFPVEEPGLTELITSVLGVAEDLRERSAGEPRPPTTT